MIELKNNILKVDLHPKGAEIHRIEGLQDGINYMWKRDSSQWANSAPILFPIVGALKNNECHIDGKTYTMTQHGFSRHNEYQVHQESDQKVTFTLTSNEDIQKQYPYLFVLNVTYTLIDNCLKCTMNVNNIDDKAIYFQIGGHPAFACPFTDQESSNDYYLEFSDNETLDIKIIDVEQKGMSRKREPFFENEKRFFVRQALFNRDALVFKDFQSHTVSLKSLNHQKSIAFHMNGFDHLGIWAAKHVGGLIAIEPWVGHSDYVDFTGEFKDKESCVKLEPGKQFTCEFTVEINQ